MAARDDILRMLDQARRAPVPVKPGSNLCTDLGLDSLAFMQLLLRIEDAFGIAFSLPELRQCLQAGRLIALVEEKIRSLPHD